MSDLITIPTWLNNSNYYIVIIIVPISFILCCKLRYHCLKNRPNNNLLVSNTQDNNLSTKLVSKKFDQPKGEPYIDSIENLDQEPPRYNEVI